MESKQTSLNIVITETTEYPSEVNFEMYNSKSEALQNFRKYLAHKIDEIRTLKIYEEESENINFFSIMMDSPAEFMLPTIRLALALVESDEETSNILQSYKWDDGANCSLKNLSANKKRIFENLKKISEDAEKNLSNYKIDLMRGFLDLQKVKQDLENGSWKMNSFQVLVKMHDIVLTSIKLKDFLAENSSSCSIEDSTDFNNKLIPSIEEMTKTSNTLELTANKSSKKSKSHKCSLGKVRSPSRNGSRRSSDIFKNGVPGYLKSTASTRSKSINKDAQSMYDLPQVPQEKKVLKTKKSVSKEPIRRIDTEMMENYRRASLNNLIKCNELKQDNDIELKK